MTMKVITLMSVIGFPSVFAICSWCIKTCFTFGKRLDILMKAQQAQMRSQLLEQYHYYMDGGWISEEHLEDWENQYQAYHSLGDNGIMDARRKTLFTLPNTKEDAERENK